MAPKLLSPRRLCLNSPRLRSPRAALQTTPRAYSASTNGSGLRAASYNIHEPHEVYIADLDLTRPDAEDPMNPTRFVPPMSTVRVQEDRSQYGEQLQLARDNEALKGELATVKHELVQSQEEVERLHMQLADKERTLQATKADLIETRLELQRTDDRLREVEERLSLATNERSEYRQYLLEAQQELQQTRAELLEWSEGLVELKSVMEGLDDDLCDLFGEDPSYHEAVEDAVALGDALAVHGELPAMPAPSEGPGAFEAAMRDLKDLSEEMLRQAEEDKKLFRGH